MRAQLPKLVVRCAADAAQPKNEEAAKFQEAPPLLVPRTGWRSVRVTLIASKPLRQAGSQLSVGKNSPWKGGMTWSRYATVHTCSARGWPYGALTVPFARRLVARKRWRVRVQEGSRPVSPSP